MSNFFVDRTEAIVSIPFVEGATITVRALTGRELERAQAAQVQNVRNGLTARGASAAFERLISGKFSEDDLGAVQADPLRDVDRLCVVRDGLLGCSLIESLERTPERDPIGELTDEALEFVAREVMRRTKPERFQTAEEQQESRKNG